MKLTFPGRRSENLEDYRGGRGGSGAGFPLPIGVGAGLGIPGAIITLILLVVLGGNPFGGGSGTNIDNPFQQFPSSGQGQQPIPRDVDPQADQVDFISTVLDDVQQSWANVFEASGRSYTPTKLVLFTQSFQTGCGAASSATGPFYCPLDQQVYLDLSFFEELSKRFGAPGDFAQAYVLAHEIGHHVQKLTGVEASVRDRQQSHPDEANALSVRLELQADCLAGVWGYSAAQRGLLEPGDVDEGLAAAASVGDDRIQKQATGRTNPESWAHGSSDQRAKWFRRGLEGGDPSACDTFSGEV